MLTITATSVKTLEQDDTEINATSDTGSDVLTGGVDSIGERKKVRVDFLITAPGVGETLLELPYASLYVNIALFMPVGFAYSEPSGPPNTGFSLILPSSVVATAAIEMFFYSTGATAPEANKNFRAWFYGVDATNFAIEVEYYMTYDMLGYLNSATKNNQWKFLSESVNEQNFNIAPSSVYGVEKQLRLMTYINQPSPAKVEKQEHFIYNTQANSFNAFTNITDAADNTLTYINANNDTAVKCTVTTAHAYATFFAKIIKIANDTTVDMIDNYGLSEQLIDSYASDGLIIKGPYNVYDDSFSNYVLEFTIDPSTLEVGANYRIIIQGYGAESEFENLTGISQSLAVVEVAPYCETPCPESLEIPANLAITGTLSDINTEYSGNFLTCVIEERIKTELVVDYTDNRWLNNLNCRFGGEEDGGFSNDLRTYLKAVYCDIYTEYVDAGLGGTVRNYLDRKYMQKVAFNTYSTNGITFDFTGDVLTLSYQFRNSNQTGNPAISTYLDGAPYFPIQDNQYWGGKTIFIRWRLSFYYPFTTPFTDNLDFIQKLVVKDYSEDVTFDPEPLSACPDNEFCVDAEIVLANPEDYYLINTIERNPPTNIAWCHEAEDFAPLILAQETEPEISSQDTGFTGGNANFCVNPAALTIGNTYKITAMAKKNSYG